MPVSRRRHYSGHYSILYRYFVDRGGRRVCKTPLRKPIRVTARSDVHDSNETSAVRTIGHSDRIGNSPQISPSHVRHGSTQIIRPDGCLSPGFCSVPQVLQPQTRRMMISHLHGRSYRSSLLVPQACSSNNIIRRSLLQMPLVAVNAVTGGVWQAWQTLTQNKVVRYSFGISSHPW